MKLLFDFFDLCMYLLNTIKRRRKNCLESITTDLSPWASTSPLDTNIATWRIKEMRCFWGDWYIVSSRYCTIWLTLESIFYSMRNCNCRYLIKSVCRTVDICNDIKKLFWYPQLVKLRLPLNFLLWLNKPNMYNKIYTSQIAVVCFARTFILVKSLWDNYFYRIKKAYKGIRRLSFFFSSAADTSAFKTKV